MTGSFLFLIRLSISLSLMSRNHVKSFLGDIFVKTRFATVSTLKIEWIWCWYKWMVHIKPNVSRVRVCAHGCHNYILPSLVRKNCQISHSKSDSLESAITTGKRNFAKKTNMSRIWLSQQLFGPKWLIHRWKNISSKTVPPLKLFHTREIPDPLHCKMLKVLFITH